MARWDQTFVVLLGCFATSQKEKKSFRSASTTRFSPRMSVQMKPFTGAYLLHDCFRGMSVFAGCRSFILFSFDRVSHDLLGQYARRERETSLQHYNVTFTCSATVPANAALMCPSTHSLGALHASGGVPAACAFQSEKSSVGCDMK